MSKSDTDPIKSCKCGFNDFTKAVKCPGCGKWLITPKDLLKDK